MSEGLDHLTFEERQQLLRLLVERVTVREDRIRVETIIRIDDEPVKLRTLRGEPV